MQRLPWLVFDNLASGDLNKIFLNANVHIKDAGSGLPMYITVIDLTNLDGTIVTIADLLAATTQWLEMFPDPHGYINEDAGANFIPDAKSKDFFEYSVTQDSNIDEMINTEPGESGTIVIHKNPSLVLTWDASYNFPLGAPVMERVTNVFEYKVLNNKIIMDFVQDDQYLVMFSFTGSFPVIDGTYETSPDGITYVAGGTDMYVRSNDITKVNFNNDNTMVSIANMEGITSCASMFAGFSIPVNTNNINFSEVTNFNNMFANFTGTCHGNIDTTLAPNNNMYGGSILTSPTTSEQSSIMSGINWVSPGCP